MAGEGIIDSLPPPRLLMTTDAVGGVWQYSLDLIAAFVRGGAEILLVNLGPRPNESQREQIRSLPRTTLIEGDFRLEWMSEPWDDVDHSGEWLLSIARSFRPDVIHLNGYSHAALNWNAPVISVAHSCVFSWWRAVRGNAPGAEWSEYKRRVITGLSAATAVVAPSRYMAHALEAEYGIQQQNISVIHNFSASIANGTAHKQPFVLAAGRLWDPAKNLHLLQSIADHISWPLYIAGNKEGNGQPEQPATSIHLLGPLPHAELLHRMEEASLFAHPALYEPFGLAVLEAAQRGCCLILADIPSLRELWSDSAVFIDPQNSAAWSSEINRLIDHPAERRQLASAARSRASQFSESAAVAQYLHLYGVVRQARQGAAA